MKCNSCANEYPQPEIIEGTAYFVCVNCGNVHEVKDYQVYTKEERVELFEKENGVKLPKEYINYAGTNDSWVVKLPPYNSDTTQYYFGEGFYEIGKFMSLEPDEGSSIFDNAMRIQSWDLPRRIVLIEGDGHTWLALDYRKSKDEPKVIVIESSASNSLEVANSFTEFVQLLLPYESVYDLDGNVIYNS